MQIETEVDPDEAHRIAQSVQQVLHSAEPALSAEELHILNEAVDYIESVGNIERGEQILESEVTGRKYRVTKWIDTPGDGYVALQKEEVQK